MTKTISVKARDMVDKKPIELNEGIDLAIGALFEKIASLEQRVLNLERGIRGGNEK